MAKKLLTKKHTNQQKDLVVNQFESQMELYTSHGSGAKALAIDPIVSFLLKQAKNSGKKSALVVCEFGGGNGAALEGIKKRYAKRTKSLKKTRPLRLENAELVGEFGKHQIDKSIHFHETSVLDSGFADDSFDVVFTRHVFHHLIHSALSQTRKNQQMAVQEMLRVVKPGGIIVIEEQTNQSDIANAIIFYASTLMTKMKINFEALQISEHTKIGYLRHNQLLQHLLDVNHSPDTEFAVKILEQRNEQWKQIWWLRYPLLLWNNGATVIVAQKR